MKTNLLLTTLLSLSLSILFAQPSFEWVTGGGGANLDSAPDIAFDGLGNHYTVSNRYNASYQPAMWFGKRTNAGNTIWAKIVSNGIRVQASKLVADAAGNLYIAGEYEGTADFNPGTGVFNMTSNGNNDYFLVKYDPNGNFIWAKGFGGSDDDDVRDIKIDNNGDIVIVGAYSSTVDFDPGTATLNHTAVGSRDVFIQKLSSNGDLIWVKTIGGTGHDSGQTVTIDQNDNITTSGAFYTTVDFDPGVAVSNHTSNGSFDIFILKLNTTGNYIWSKSIGGTANDIPFRMTSSPNGGIYITGNFSGSTDFDPSGAVNTMTALGSPYDCFVLKLDINGDYVWSEHFGSATGHGAGRGIALDANENVYVTGTYDETVDFDPGVGISNLYAPDEDFFVLKLSSAGAYQWVIGSGGSLPGTGNAIQVNANNDILVAGDFYGTRDFDPSPNVYTLTSGGAYDYFNWMLSQCSPTSLTPDVANLTNVTDQCEVTSLTPPTATNNCSEIVTGIHDATLPIATQGTTIVTWTYDDGNGNTSTQTQDVVIEDVTAPVADNNSLPDVTSECSVTSLTDPTATDNCAGSVLVSNNASFPIVTQGTTTVTWTYDDGNGNTSTQNQNVIITDVTTPIASLANLPDINEACDVTPVAPTANDNCAGSLTGTPDVSFPITASGTTVVTWTYADGNGNSSTQTQNVIITPIDNGLTQVNADTWSADAAGYNYQWVDCDNANAPVPGATSQAFTPSFGGNFACEIDNGSCSVITSCFSSSVEIDENQFGDALVLYPNPTFGDLSINLGNVYSNIKAILYNSLGEEILCKEVSSASVINLSIEGSAGVYIVDIQTSEGKSARIEVIKK